LDRLLEFNDSTSWVALLVRGLTFELPFRDSSARTPVSLPSVVAEDFNFAFLQEKVKVSIHLDLELLMQSILNMSNEFLYSCKELFPYPHRVKMYAM